MPLLHKLTRNLLDLHSVSKDRRQRRFQINFQLDSPLLRLAAHETQYLVDHVVDVEGRLLEGTALEEGAHALHDIGGVVAGIKNVLNQRACLVHVGGFVGERLKTHMRVGDDCSERLVDFVGDGGRSFAQGRNLSSPRESLFDFL